MSYMGLPRFLQRLDTSESSFSVYVLAWQLGQSATAFSVVSCHPWPLSFADACTKEKAARNRQIGPNR
jgi:hypothetical protein